MKKALPPPVTERCIGRIATDRPMRFTLLAKRTFQLTPAGPEPAEQAEPFIEEELLAPAPGTDRQVLRRAPDAVPDRDACDVIVLATARSASPVTSRDVVFEAPGITRRLVVQGDRTVVRRGTSWAFSPPEPWQEMPLGWDRAYGGTDGHVEPDYSDREELVRALMFHPGGYPRNEVGRGYSLADSTSGPEGMPLPNVEDPENRLTASRLECPTRDQWHLQPRPAGLGFVRAHWFPRSVQIGTIAGRWPDLAAGPVPEEAEGFLPRGLTEHQRRATPDQMRILPGFFQVSAPGMAVPGWTGDEELRITGLEGRAARTLALPGAPPTWALETPAGVLSPASRLFQVLWDIDAGILTMVWGAGLAVGEGALKGLTPAQLMELPAHAE